MANHWFKKTPSDTVLPAPEHLEYVDDGAAAVLLTTPTRARVLLWACFLFFCQRHRLGSLGRAG